MRVVGVVVCGVLLLHHVSVLCWRVLSFMHIWHRQFTPPNKGVFETCLAGYYRVGYGLLVGWPGHLARGLGFVGAPRLARARWRCEGSVAMAARFVHEV